MRNLFKIFFMLFLLIACKKNNTSSLSELVNYKGTYLGDEVIVNDLYVNCIVTIEIADNGDIELYIRLSNEDVYFYTDSNYMTKLGDAKYEIQISDYYIFLDFSDGLYFIYKQTGKEISGYLTKQ